MKKFTGSYKKECMSVLFLTTMLYSPAEAHSGPSLVSKKNVFARVVKGFMLALLTIFCEEFRWRRLKGSWVN